jgi:hypothetical protein
VVIEHQQRTLYKEGNWIDTSVYPPSLHSATSAWEALEEDLENKADGHHFDEGAYPWKHYQDKEHFRPRKFDTRTLINIIIGMSKNNTQSMFALAKGSRTNVKHQVVCSRMYETPENTLLHREGDLSTKTDLNTVREALRNTIVKC